MSMNTFDKIIGYSSEKKELEQISDILKNKKIYEKLGVSSPKGLLLHGVPGVGKTLMAKALITESGRQAFVCRKNQPNGEFVKEIKMTFEKALKAAPSIVFLDDMDKFANGDENHRDAEEYVTVQSCIDEIKNEEVFVLATANDIRSLPYSLVRAGRFDRVLKVGVPQGEDAVKIVAYYLKGKNVVSEIDAKAIARIMEGRSCAELETVINEAGVCAGYERAEKIMMEHFLEACMISMFDIPAGIIWDSKGKKVDLSDRNDIATQIIYHEAGHAVISEILFPGSVTLVSAYNQQGKRGGFTAYCNHSNNNQNDPIKKEKGRVIVSLGGMAALEQRFGIMDGGNSSDLGQAFKKMNDLITEFGVCGFSLHDSSYSNSEKLLERQEQAVATEVEHCYRKAKEILNANSQLLEKIANALAEKWILTMKDIQALKEKVS